MSTSQKKPIAHQGFSLVELLVVIVIVLMMSLAIFGVMSSSEGKKRTMTSVNDINQAGNYAMYQIEKNVRGAGSGFAQDWAQLFGCQLSASLSGQQILPFINGTMAAPFKALGTALLGKFSLAPLIIAKGMSTPNISGQASDVLILMSGTAGYGEVPTTFTSIASSSQLNLINTVAFNPNDLVLLADQSGVAGAPCMIEQVSPTFVVGAAAAAITALPLAGNYYANPIGTADFTSFSNNALAMNLGNAISNMPNFQLIGVGDNDVLYQYDLLQGSSFNTPTPVADGVFELHALYGVDTVGDGLVHAWVDPGSVGYDYLTLEGANAGATLFKIKAVRIGLITRTSLMEKATIPPATTGPLTLFSDLGAALTYTRVLNPTEQNFRYRTVELTIPLRNSLLLN